MVKDRITDGKRIGQFLSSEITGLDAGTLADAKICDADPSAEPTPDGSLAYRIAHQGETVATVVLFPNAVEVRSKMDRPWTQPNSVTEITVKESTLTVESATAVKEVIDTLAESLAAT
ncbi:hypothetical protein ACFQJ7_08035 [Halovenus rubra]|uniref:DUF7993 domain-containing protein n=2 Tax=Halovenus rubra TaxID=869890 RepID=A0ABD5X811_9EURY|nr:hypothetical protein [Halovenus rubra]